MEWAAILQTFLSGALGSGLFVSLLFFRENKRAKQLENEVVAASQWRELFEKESEKNVDLNQKIDKLFKELGDIRTRNDMLSSRIAVLQILRCKKISCTDREPPIDEDMNLEKIE